ncbi:NIPSNAP family protein [Kribbella albertanoniae]|uniref:NIPSNAP family protein n=1 Tax=Kribbella albertanoniae TaxID=1266829 RepID=A0A4R4PLI6_9ACTN|nr:NIPSNAP family protein [Kribbella albertanoniae]TDC23001.1 NIPSNAP family protein [Kribbella albertanoniae]
MVDLRQYTLHPGRRDTLIDIFDEHFVEGQEVCGMHIAGQFRDLNDPDRFVWLRGFRTLDARAEALKAFYYGPVWRQHAEAANATMLDSDNALLLQPINLGPDYPQPDALRPDDQPNSVIAGFVHPADDAFPQHFLDNLLPVLSDLGVSPLAIFRSLSVENNFPALPLRDDTVLVWLARFTNDTTYELVREALSGWKGQELRLRPTMRSQVR